MNIIEFRSLEQDVYFHQRTEDSWADEVMYVLKKDDIRLSVTFGRTNMSVQKIQERAALDGFCFIRLLPDNFPTVWDELIENMKEKHANALSFRQSLSPTPD